jgi:hypothetical protein
MSTLAGYDALGMVSKEIIAGGIATCPTWQEFYEYYRLLCPREKHSVAQKRAARLWKHVKFMRPSDSGCPMCGEPSIPESEGGYCSYNCESGGGARVGGQS